MDLWHSNNMKVIYVNLLRIIVFELFEPWTMLIIFLFLALVLSIWLTIKPNNLRKFYSRISEKQLNLHFCGSGPVKSVLFISPSVCLSIRLWYIFLRIYNVGFFNFLHDILQYILKSNKAGFSKIRFAVLVIE